MDEAKARIKQRNSVLIFTACVLMYMVYAARGVFLPVILSMALAYMLHPVVKALEQGHVLMLRMKVSRVTAILISYVFLFVFFSLIVTFTAQPFAAQVKKLSANFDDYMQQFRNLLQQAKQHYLSYDIPDEWTDVVAKEAKEFVGSLFQVIRKAAVDYPKTFFNYLVELILVPILTFYLLLDREKLKAGVLQYIPVKNKDKLKEILEQMSGTLDGYVRGQVLLCGIMAVLSTVFFYFLGIDFALIAGLFAGATKAVPIVGSIIGVIPPSLLALLEPQSMRKIIYIAIFFTVVYLVENKVLLPKIMEYYVNLHPVTVIISLLIGGKMAGVLGMFVAVPAAGLIKILWVNFLESYFNERGENVG